MDTKLCLAICTLKKSLLEAFYVEHFFFCPAYIIRNINCISVRMSLKCNWPDCKKIERDAANLRSHMYAKHWPWSVRQYVCEFCRKGYHSSAGLISHIRSKDHQKNELSIKPYHAKEHSLEWLENRRKTLLPEHYQHLTSYEIVTQEDINDDVLVNHYSPTHPGMDSDTVQCTRTASMSAQDVPSNITECSPTPEQMTPSSQKLTKTSTSTPQLPTNPHTHQHHDQTQSKPTTAGEIKKKKKKTTSTLPNPPTDQHDVQDLSQHSTAGEFIMPKTISPLSTSSPPKQQPLTSSMEPDTPESSTMTPSKSVRKKRTPTPLQPPVAPSQLTEDCVDGPTIKRRKLQDQVDDAEDTDEMLHILAKAMDDQNARLESLEASIKVKCKEIAYEQSRHLATLIQTIVETEAYKTKKYFRKLLKTLQKDLMDGDRETIA